MKKFLTRLSVIIILLLIVLSVFVAYAERVIFPRGAEILHSYAETSVFEIFNTTCVEIMDKYNADYRTLSEIIYSDDGKISSININYSLVNKIKSEISTEISKKFSSNDDMSVYVPIGSFSNNMYLVGKGPKLKFVIVQRGFTQTDFEQTFESGGINQTLHTLKITMNSDIALMLPFYDTHTYMKTSVILAQTVINGECPIYSLTGGDRFNDR